MPTASSRSRCPRPRRPSLGRSWSRRDRPLTKESDAMPNESRTDMQKIEGMSPVLEQTRPGPAYLPAVDIFETDAAITVLADMPGVKPEQLDIDLRENVLTLTGRVTPAGAPGET